MEEANYPDPIDLATILYDNGLVRINSKDTTDPYKQRENALNAIARKIRNHINADSSSCLQGEYALAYSKIFKCSTDYLFCISDIKSQNKNIRSLCDETGLTEQALLNFISSADKSENENIPLVWSYILESNLFYTVPNRAIELGNSAIEMAKSEAELDALIWEKDFMTGPDLLDINLDIEGLQEAIASKQREIDGILNALSSDISSSIRDKVFYSLENVRSAFASHFLKQAKERHIG